ncbi:predicted protein [Nematostella vectensis]|uniref:Protein-cysteine N-palmitoyltransferase HHAT n=1 Tax=Nematostella vectensis TaxID=45351 RepID=A7SDP8_NEMVE|nr:predicted protein [Nematostella vectensis]|eukprot:XP_001630213.1 predicted protein [Nematostella vectensis]
MAPKTTVKQRKSTACTKKSAPVGELNDSKHSTMKHFIPHGALPLPEITLYCTVWMSMMVYLVYVVIEASNEYKDHLWPGDFSKGWKFIGRDKDICDAEWEFWSNLKLEMILAYCLHSTGGLVISHYLPMARRWYYPAFTVAFLVLLVGIKSVLYVVAVCTIFYLTSKTQSVSLVWTTVLGILATLQFETARNFQFQFLSSNPDKNEIVLFVTLMSLLRCVSFCLECCWHRQDGAGVTRDKTDKPSPSFTLLDLLLYNFYLPLFANGPVMTYKDFHTQFHQPVQLLTKPELLTILWDAIRTLWWYIFLEVYLHYMYSAALVREAPVFKGLSAWTITGIMYSQLNIFLTKYVVLYLLSGLFARLDHLDPPGAPRCVSTLYLFGDMWRYFDRGLNVWMKRYIYIPMGGSRKGIPRQITGSFLAFTFVWAWHGGQVDNLWWFIPNCLGVVIEGLAGVVSDLPEVKAREASLSESNRRRVRALFGSVTLCCLILSNLVFLQGSEPVWYYITRVYWQGFPVCPLVSLCAFYCCVQTNMELNRYKRGKW